MGTASTASSAATVNKGEGTRRTPAPTQAAPATALAVVAPAAVQNPSALPFRAKVAREYEPIEFALPLRSQIIEGIRTEKRFTGDKRTARLAIIAEIANEHDRRAVEAERTSLGNAFFAGEALQEAKRLLGGAGKWGRWLRSNFKGKSEETSRVYRQVYRQWNHPRLVAMRQSGQGPTSIRGLMAVLRREGEGKTKPTSRPAELLKSLLGKFSFFLKHNCIENELEVMDAHFADEIEPALNNICRKIWFCKYETSIRGDDEGWGEEEWVERAKARFAETLAEWEAVA